jgi:beta-glucanase (GH16 family)
LLLQQQLLSPTANSYVENLNLFDDGPATVTVDVDGTSTSTTLVDGGYTASTATVINDTNFTDPEDASNTVWRFSVRGGVANIFLGTGDLSADPLLDDGFDLSGDGNGMRLFDITVISLVSDPTLTVKIDSGYPNLGKVALLPSQYTVGSWRRVSIDFADLVDQGSGLDLSNVGNAFVIEVTGGDAEFYLDNIFISRACPEVDGCNATIKTNDPSAPLGGYESPTSYPGYTLAWRDEFSGAALNTSDWTYELGGGGWGNNEAQYYRAQNTSVANGHLTIEARQENFGGRNYTSSRLITKDKQSFRYGRIDIRAVMPEGQGMWPALWMLGSNISSVGWPRSGEIDIMEMVGGSGREDTVHGTGHWDNDGSYASFGRSYTLNSGTFADEFHVFSIEWDSSQIRWYVDGQQYNALSISSAGLSEFREEFFFIFNIAVGGNWPGYPDGSTVFPQRMLVDYVRVFEKQ